MNLTNISKFFRFTQSDDLSVIRDLMLNVINDKRNHMTKGIFFSFTVHFLVKSFTAKYPESSAFSPSKFVKKPTNSRTR